MKNSSIQWTDHTFNPWEGCTKVAPECAHCYAETLVDHRFGRAKWGKGQPRRRTSENLWKQPLRWNQQPWVCDNCGFSFKLACPNCYTSAGSTGTHRARVFCLSLGDWLDEEVPIEWLADLLDLIARCKNLDWQLLTKRPQNWNERIRSAHNDLVARNAPSYVPGAYAGWIGQGVGGVVPPENIWIGVSAGADQKASLEIPAKVHFLSCEPMLHALDHFYLPTQEFDWIIFGGESGKNARPCNIDWIRDGVQFCRRNDIAPFVKQLGAVPLDRGLMNEWPDSTSWGERDGWNRLLLDDSHGGDMSEWPEDLRVREFPKAREAMAA